MGKKKGGAKPKGMSLEEFSKEQQAKEAQNKPVTGLEAILESKQTAQQKLGAKVVPPKKKIQESDEDLPGIFGEIDKKADMFDNYKQADKFGLDKTPQ